MLNVPTGVYSVRISSIGYETYIASDVTITSGRPTMLEIELAERVLMLDAAEVTASFFSNTIEASTSTQSFNFEEIRRAPGVQEDVLRATALLPGVNVTAAGRNDLIVRGGAPYENLFIVDNIEVPNINHFGSQGSTGGPLSIINLDFVRNVEFSAGGFPAKFGDKTSSLTHIKLRNGNESKFGGKATISASQFGLNLEGPVTEKGSFWFSARRSYLDFLFNAAGFSFIPEYWDFQGKFNYRLNQNNSLTFLAISAINTVKLNNDDLDARYDNSRITVPEQLQYFSGLTWKRTFSNGFTTVTLGRSYVNFETYQNDSTLTEIYRNNSKEGEISFKTDLVIQTGSGSELTVGNRLKYGSKLDYDILIPGYLRTDDEGTPQPLRIDTTLNSIKNATYASYTFTAGKSKVTAGGRLNYFDFTEEQFYFAPRLSYTYSINEKHSLITSLGSYYQSPSYLWLIGGTEGKLSAIKADQAVVGYRHNPRPDLLVQVELFYKLYDKYPGRIWRPQAVLAPAGFQDATSDIPFGLEPIDYDASGYSRGIELFVQKRFSEIPIYGLFSVTLSESAFKSLEGKERPGAYDTPFIMNLAVGYRFNSKWEVSSKFRAAEGIPTTPFDELGQLDFSRYNEGERLPFFHSLDVRVDRRWNFSKLGLIAYIDIQNVYNNQAVSSRRWDEREQKVIENTSIGILPTIGVSLEF